jgi:hypothetical protein
MYAIGYRGMSIVPSEVPLSGCVLFYVEYENTVYNVILSTVCLFTDYLDYIYNDVIKQSERLN